MFDRLWLEMSDGHEVFVSYWYQEGLKPKAIVQIAHGMAEHIERYHEFANFLVSHGIFVYGNDHRGHGKTGEKAGILGFFAEENGFERAVDDLKEINSYIKHASPQVPVFIMGHSMGSFLVRRFIQRYEQSVSGVILSGTGGNPGFLGKLGKLVANSQIRKHGKRTESPLMNQLSFGNFNKRFSDGSSEFNWLTRDAKEMQKYIDDPLCGFIATAGFYSDLMTGLERIHHNQEVRKIDKELPFFIFSGDQDPVGKDTKGVKQVIDQYTKHGIHQIEYKYYYEGRHEMLNELNREEVMRDILEWLEKRLNA
ncbi:lysophospholipase [Cytobacillus spongiae]|uniref:alpha/beta hydrolase n=1 Tax=Cytobacillus spongiae TaxID=2901381 RepID=UPI001F4344E1|nr:alpha/beta hydrolase [Cytobacillus spongiae]UII57079.1 lysophospholipase [Cytobacillus spongiae]